MENVYLIYQYNSSKTDSRFLSIVCKTEETAKKVCLDFNKVYPNNEHFVKELPLLD